MHQGYPIDPSIMALTLAMLKVGMLKATFTKNYTTFQYKIMALMPIDLHTMFSSEVGRY